MVEAVAVVAAVLEAVDLLGVLPIDCTIIMIT